MPKIQNKSYLRSLKRRLNTRKIPRVSPLLSSEFLTEAPLSPESFIYPLKLQNN
jgi:hypothetical protein